MEATCMVHGCDDCLEALQRLRLTPPCTAEEIKASYKDHVKVWHPDRFPGDERLRYKAEEETKRINAAYDYLRDHVCYTEYSRENQQPGSNAADVPSPPNEAESRYPFQQVQEEHGLWRGTKVFLRAVWRLTKLVVALLLAAILILGLVLRL